ncbi:hypothetical protein ACSV4D_12345 [Flavobacterium sp. ARAG 55.4]|uniref:Lipoprotein n=1 Tax=Flavobacterium plantiphilum TaxID=3163297 RepID=A0ABW8XP01_9FLAO
MKQIILFKILIFFILIYGCKKDNYLQQNVPIKKNINKLECGKIKFETKYKFDSFPVKKILSTKSNLELNTNISTFSRYYKTRIKQSFEKEEINFAGKYIINYWGCGSPCAVGIAINAQNGKLIEIPASSVGYEFKINSRLLIVNPPDSVGYYSKDCAYCKPELYLLDTIKSKFVKLED